jgi:hypothetical protein
MLFFCIEEVQMAIDPKYEKDIRVLEIIHQALLEREDVLTRLHFFSTLDEQLKFMLAFFKGENDDHARLHDINVGVISVREIESFDEELANLLSVAQYIAHKKAHGLVRDPVILDKYIK